MTSMQPQWAKDYLCAFQAANGKSARLESQDGGFVVVAEDGGSTGIVYKEAEILRLTQRLIERVAAGVPY